MLILCMSFMFCTVIGCDCQLIIKENYDDDDEYCEGPLVVVKCLLFFKSSHKVSVCISLFTFLTHNTQNAFPIVMHFGGYICLDAGLFSE